MNSLVPYSGSQLPDLGIEVEPWLSPQQQQIILWAVREEGSAVLEAKAGSGKTTTLVELCRYLTGSVVFTAFNKKIADEIGYKLQTAGISHVKSGTFHSLGFGAWRKAAPGVKVEAKKSEMIMEDLGVALPLRSFISNLVSLGKQHGIGIFERDHVSEIEDVSKWRHLVDHYDLEERLINDFVDDPTPLVNRAIDFAILVLLESIERNEELIDFDDMMYAPLFHDVAFPQFDWVLIDEAQDTNPLRREMAKAMLKDSGRLVAVGDPRQAIYGFTGADHDALDLIKSEFGAKTLPLSVSYRCARRVIAEAQKIVPDIEHAVDAEEGSVTTISDEMFEKITPDRSDAILCRINRPLVSLCLSYIRRKIPAHIEGRDIGMQLISLVRKWKSIHTVAELRIRLEDYLKEETERLVAKGQEGRVIALQDKIDSIFAVMEGMHDDDSKEEVASTINAIFQDTEGKPVRSITLSTIHKSKGREWNRVFIYGRNKWMPLRFGGRESAEWEQGQEQNLIYVAITRAKKELVNVEVG